MNNRKAIIEFIVIFALLSIAGTARTMSHGASPELPADLDDYKHVNTLVAPSADSPIQGIHHFYMGKTGRKTFMQGGTDEYPDGTTFVAKVYKPVKTEEGRYMEGDLAAYTMMKKDSGSEATKETGGWFFVMFGPDRKNKGVDPVKTCFGCHEPSPETDYVLSKPLK